MNYLIKHTIENPNNLRNGKLWIGRNILDKVIDISEINAFIKPHPDMHSLAENISHLNFWRIETTVKVKTAGCQ